MQDRATAMARCDLPVPVPPISTALRCSAMKPAVARSRISASLIGVPVKSKLSMSLASGSLAMVSLLIPTEVARDSGMISPTIPI